MSRARTRSLLVLGALGMASLVLVTGCRFDGIQSLPLPGAAGSGGDMYSVEVELPDVGNLKPNAQVKVGDVPVGTVRSLGVRGWHAVARVGLQTGTELPANATAAVGQNSLLGASYLEMSAPKAEPAAGALADGAVVPLARSRAYPTTEQVLASTSVVLNGGGLNQLETTTRELQRALGGNGGAVGALLPQLDTFVAGLDAQRGDIVTALEGIDRLSGTLAGQRKVIADALDGIAPALEVLNRERTDLTASLAALRDLSRTGSALVEGTKEDLVANLRNLEPVLKSLADSDKSLVDSLGLAATFPFPAATTPNACRGDFCNLNLTVDLTLGKLDAALFSGTPLQGLPNTAQGLLGGVAPGPAGQALDPLRGALPLGPAPGAGADRPPPAPSATDTPSRPPSGGGLLDGLLGGG